MNKLSDETVDEVLSKSMRYIEYRLFRSRLKHHDREDLKQELMEKSLECYLKFNPNRGVKFTTYLQKALDNTTIRHLGDFKKYKTAVSEYSEKPEYHREHEDFEKIVELKELIANSPLSDKKRKVLELRAEGYTLKEIGDKFNFTMERIRLLEKEAIETMKRYMLRQ